MANEQGDMILLCGLWEGTTRNNEPFFKGRLGMARVLIFVNNRKQGENDPHYWMFLSPTTKKEEAPENDAPPPGDTGAPGDDIPF